MVEGGVTYYKKLPTKCGLHPYFYAVVAVALLVVHALMTGSAMVNLSWVYSGFNSTSLLFGTGCVDGSGSLSGGAFNQLKLVTLSVI